MPGKPTYDELKDRLEATEQQLARLLAREKTHQENDERFREIASRLPGMFYQFVLHDDGSISIPYISDRVYEYSGSRPEDITKNPSILFEPIHPDDREMVQNAIAESAKTLENYRVQHRLIDPDGKTRWFNVESIPQRLENGDILWNGLSIEITHLKDAEQSFRSSEAQLAEAQRLAGIGHWEWDLKTDQIHWSDVIYHIHGYEPGFSQPTFELVWNSIHHDDREKMGKALDAAKNQGIPYDIEYRIIRTSGEVRHIHSISKIDKDTAGEIVRLFGTAQDVTRRAQIETALRKSEALYRTLADELPMGLCIIRDGEYVYVNKAYADLVGYSREEIESPLPSVAPRLIHPDDTDTIRKRIDAGLSDHAASNPFPFRLIHKDGSLRWVEGYSRVVESGGQPAIQVIMVDTTEQKKVEEALRESEKRYRSWVEYSPDGVYVSIGGKIIYANPAAADIWGVKNPDVLIGRVLFDLIHTDYRQKAKDRYRVVAEGGKSVPLSDFIFLRQDGGQTYVEAAASQAMIDGKPAVQTTVRDITQRIRIETSLRESEEKFRGLFATVSDAIVVFDAGTKEFIDVNEAALALYGYTRDEFLDLRQPDISAEDTASEESIRQTLRGELNKIPMRYHRKKDGSVFPVEISVGLFHIQDRDLLCGVIRDISERIQVEEERETLFQQLQQAQKMEAIGTLAGGIAHDFNNILTPFIIHNELALMDLPEGHPVQHNLQESLKAGYRARDLVKQILAFSRQQDQDISPIMAGTIIREALKLLRASLPTTIDMTHRYGADKDMVLANATQIHQVIMNLCTNAGHAMSKTGGVLDVRLDNEHVDSDVDGPMPDLAPGDFLKLTVKDTGHGMDRSIRERIFEPYFTTKEKERGTGLGLSVVHGIVKSLNGGITVDSEPGKGTTFTVYLPLVTGVDDPASGTAKPKALPTGNEHVLFVDDEKTMVDTIQPFLERLGYRVTSRTSSYEALEVFRNEPDRFDLVITDQTMPNLTGGELAKKLMEIRPEVPIILCTGYSERMDEVQAKYIGIKAFVMKPILIGEIAETIRKVLDVPAADDG